MPQSPLQIAIAPRRLSANRKHDMGRWTPRILALVCACRLILWSQSAEASPWAEVGDAQLRSDIEVLAAAGVIDNVTTQWPLPWAGILTDLRDENRMAHQPDFVRAAAARVVA